LYLSSFCCIASLFGLCHRLCAAAALFILAAIQSLLEPLQSIINERFSAASHVYPSPVPFTDALGMLKDPFAPVSVSVAVAAGAPARPHGTD